MIFCFRIFGRVEKTIFGKVVAIMPRDRKWPSARAVTVGVLLQVINFIVYTNLLLLLCSILEWTNKKRSRSFQNWIWYINAAAPGNKPAKSNSSWAFLAHEKWAAPSYIRKPGLTTTVCSYKLLRWWGWINNMSINVMNRWKGYLGAFWVGFGLY